MDYGNLPKTGMAAVAVGPVVLGAPELAAVAAGLIATGLLFLRYGFRYRKSVTEA